VHHLPGQPLRAVAGDDGGGGLLQGFVGEQPAGDISQAVELRGGLTPQQGGLDQSGGMAGEPFAEGGDVGYPAGIGEAEPRRLGQGGCSGVAGQIRDIGGGERQEGLTPVIITL
jgi:hypothetical protein